MDQFPVPATLAPPHDLAELEDEITELAAHLNAATYRLLTLISEFDERGGWHGAGLRSCAHWLNWKCGIDLGAAREKVRVAHALKSLPQISAALRSGRLSYSKVRAMTRVATPQNEDYLLMIAAHGTASHMERLVRNYRSVKRSEALARDKQHHALRELSWTINDDGSYVLKARLSPEQGARIVQALRETSAAMREEQRDAAEDVSAETSRRLACDCGVVHWLEDSDGTALDVGRRTRSITSTRTISATGPTAAKLASTTCCYCVATITAWYTKADTALHWM